jgi:hypothetical protein
MSLLLRAELSNVVVASAENLMLLLRPEISDFDPAFWKVDGAQAYCFSTEPRRFGGFLCQRRFGRFFT